MSNYTYTRQDVKQFEQWGEAYEVISKLMKQGMVQPSIFATGYYSAPSWNWSYNFGIVKLGGKFYEVMTQFGSIKGGREIYIPQYTKTGKRSK